MRQLPDLPRQNVSAYVFEAYRKIKQHYQRGVNLLSQEEPDGMRLKLVADDLQTRCFPLIDDLKQMRNVPFNWATSLVDCIGTLKGLLECKYSYSKEYYQTGL
jgi:hypothetical protein